MICRVCNERMVFLEVVHNCRTEGGDTFLRNHPYVCKKGDITLFKCLSCSHIQSDNLLVEDYYEDYSDEFGKKQYFGLLDSREDKIRLLREMAPNGKRLIEIGCGGGYDLKFSQMYFERVFGVEPSKKECDIAKGMGIEVIQGYFNNLLNIQDKVSAFMTFMVMEHIDNIYDILTYAYEILENGGVGLINVPNGLQIVGERDTTQIFSEHINYFTPLSLLYATNKAGFCVESIAQDKNAKELNIYIRKKEDTRNFDFYYNLCKESLTCCTKDRNSLGIYGAGTKAHIYSEMIEKGKVRHIFDSDKSKVGKYLSGIDIPVELINKEKLCSCDAIVIFASSYNFEIIDLLLKEYNYQGLIIFKDDKAFRVL